MRQFDTVAIIGVGLIGGSVGLALRNRRLVERVVGIGRNESKLRSAQQLGALTEFTTDLSRGVAEADLVVVCTPVGWIVRHVRQAAEHCRPNTLITDAGSTKRAIVDALDEELPRGCRFLGGHPLAGSHETGVDNARADLFDGSYVILTPTERTRAEDYDRLEHFWRYLGAKEVERMPADEHDRALAVTSHLPHVVAAALAATLPESLFPLAGSGLMDTSRLAAGSPELWRDIFSTNRQNVVEALTQYEEQLAALHSMIQDGDETALEALLTLAKKKRDALAS